MPNDFPIGAIMSFAGNADPGFGWLLCDGRSLARSSYPTLFDSIGTCNGGDGNNFNVPDFRGRFLRGRDAGTGRDPDVTKRTAQAPGGAIGDRVGSYQTGATAKPIAGFSTNVPRLPDSAQDVAATAIGYTLAKWNSESKAVTAEFKGGDSETRPANITMRYFIFSGA
jgi:microcystin-dependent protein